MVKRLRFPKSELNFNYTFNGGQAFRWKEFNSEKWIGTFAHKIWILSQEDNYIAYQTETNKKHDTCDVDELLLKHYLRLDEPLPELYKKWSECDIYFKKAACKFQGVRMLQQDPVEIIFTFICSSNNNISRIKSMVNKLCTFYGEEIATVDDEIYHDFPTVENLAKPSVRKDLEKAAFGYRAKYIQGTADKILQMGGSDWIECLKKLPYKEAKTELMKLPGIGAKVADCICLMSLNHLEAIPVDTHVFQIATKYYLPHLSKVKSVTDRVYNEIGDHFRSMYGQYAGWAHSVLFCDELKDFQEKKSQKNNKRRKLQSTPAESN